MDDLEKFAQDAMAEYNASKAATGSGSTNEFVRKPQYTPEAMVALMIEHPDWSHKQFGEHFGHTAKWFAGVLASKNFQDVLNPRRHEVANPALAGTLDDLMRAITVQALTKVQERLDAKEVSEEFIINAARIGIKGLGLGNGIPAAPEQPVAPEKNLTELAAALQERHQNRLEHSAPVEGSNRDFSVDMQLIEPLPADTESTE